MPSRHTPDLSHTPSARLEEADLRGVVGYQLAQASIVTDRVFENHVRRQQDLRKLEFTLLALLLANPGATARQLAKALNVTPPNIAILLDRLGERGLVQRARSKADGRLQHLSLTRAGQAQVKQAVAALQAAEAQALSNLSAAERAMLAELLHKAGQQRS